MISAKSGGDFGKEACRRAGFNPSVSNRRALVGAITANEADCTGPVESIGFGLADLNGGVPAGTHAGGHKSGGGGGNDRQRFVWVLVR